MSQGFRAPQATELYRLQRAQQVADLDNVSLKNIEIGFRGQQDMIRYNISFYTMKKKGYIFRDSSFFNVDNGKSDHFGADVMIKINLNDHVNIRGNVSFARHRYKFDYISGDVNLNGNDIDTAPRHFGSMQLTWKPADNIRAELEWVHMGAYYLDPENRHKYDGHDYLNLRAEFQFTDSYGFFLRLTNLANTKYAERADFTTFTDERYFPGRSRSLYMGVNGHF